MTEKQQYMIENNPVIKQLINQLDCDIIESENEVINKKIFSRVEYWFSKFSASEKNKKNRE